MTFWPLTNSDFPTIQTFHQFHDLDTYFDLHRIMSGFHGAFATGVACQQGTFTPPDTWFRPLLGVCICSNWDQFSRLYTDLMTAPNLAYTELRGFNGAFATGVACQQGALTLPDTWFRPPPPILGLACAPIVETRFLELAMSLLDFSPRIPLGTFSILLQTDRSISNNSRPLSSDF